MQRAFRKLRNVLESRIVRGSYKVGRTTKLIRYGSSYGGWTIPDIPLSQVSVVYCAGVGEDATFDLEIARKFGCVTHAFDPTPRSIEYARQFLDEEPNFVFHPFGLWSDDTTLRFYAPRRITDVSHSALNLQGTDEYFEAPVRSLPSIMYELGHTHIDLLKMDIEGAEHMVLPNMIQNGIFPSILCVEFDRPVPLSDIKKQIRALVEVGYEVVHVQGWNFTFIK